MVDLKLTTVDQAVLPHCYVAARIGDSQKLGRLAAERLYKFPENVLGEHKYGFIDVFQRVGGCSVSVNVEDSREQLVSLPINSGNLRFRVELAPLGKTPLKAKTPSSKAKFAKERLAEARSYLDRHNLELRLKVAMQAVMEALPEDPVGFICRRLSENDTAIEKREPREDGELCALAGDALQSAAASGHLDDLLHARQIRKKREALRYNCAVASHALLSAATSGQLDDLLHARQITQLQEAAIDVKLEESLTTTMDEEERDLQELQELEAELQKLHERVKEATQKVEKKKQELKSKEDARNKESELQLKAKFRMLLDSCLRSKDFAMSLIQASADYDTDQVSKAQDTIQKCVGSEELFVSTISILRENKKKGLESSVDVDPLAESRILPIADTATVARESKRDLTWYKCLRDVAVTESFDNDIEQSHLQQGDFVRVIEERTDSSITRGRIARGWVTISDGMDGSAFCNVEFLQKRVTFFQDEPFERYYQAHVCTSCEAFTRSMFVDEAKELDRSLELLTRTPSQPQSPKQATEKSAASRVVVHVVGEMRNELHSYATQQQQLTSQVSALAQSVSALKSIVETRGEV
mmetsp:Transcript_47154/g.74518  ORF Transcript_47154/g.74518 Transcript_47154/m.74518 type:complete len:586 (+) Transcript_47154:61-1818(+)